MASAAGAASFFESGHGGRGALFAVGEGIVGVICSETILGEGARAVAGGAVLCVVAEAGVWSCAVVPSEAGAGPRDELAAPPTSGL